ncbi:MAG: alcohol dehydrogenase [Meiothermus sp.]|uniref:Alcohol dehydrogenase n=3 Tax=Meiothermus hypogaeus TaxID=884155 RepID=A0A511R532_9DEIN|nr:putative alcohol dehydrogenase AdhA [Meiothermus hypogaeus]GEM84002.1 alcohol dehydrogenase [Meiothermus hypogaeus NBRC 106114]GIW36741.1 MAG: alcohol dehydrogenase [Meiothermus sp.]
MRAMVLEAVNQPLQQRQQAVPQPQGRQVLLRVRACGVCRTDLHIFEGDLREPKLPLVLGHEVVGEVVALGPQAQRFRVGQRVGVPWLGSTCGVCRYCRRGQENLCEQARFTGYTLDGGYAEYTLAHEDYCFALPEGYGDLEAAPLLCAGLIGYRAYRLAGEGVERLGLYGFGASAHLLAQVAVFQGKEVYAFTRPGDTAAQQLALRLGAVWAGGSDQLPPKTLDAALIFAPVGALVPQALRATTRGGVVVCAGIHMSEIPAFPYSLLWEERVVRSVANLTRQDGEAFLALAQAAGVRPEVMPFALEEANQALMALKEGRVHGAAVLRVSAG